MSDDLEHDRAGPDDDAGTRADDAEREPEAPPEPVDASYRGRAWLQALIVTIVSGATLSYAFSADAMGPLRMLSAVGLCYLGLTVATCLFLKGRGELGVLVPRRLDITAGAMVALVMYLISNLVPMVVLRGRVAEGWLWRIYVQLGDPREVAAPYVGPAILVIAALEELVWRGWVMRALRTAYGARRALWLSAVLYAAAHAGTVLTLRDADAGPNPLIVMAALFGGLVWGALALRFERMGPSLFAHAFFSWATLLFPLWRRM